MRYWFGYVNGMLLLGQGNAVTRLVADRASVQPLLEIAGKHYAAYRAAAETSRRAYPVTEENFTAALLAPLGLSTLGPDAGEAALFSSAGKILRLFAEPDPAQLAVHLLNGKIAGAYAAQNDAQAYAARVARGFADGELLILPRDQARLRAPEIQAELPGALAFLLSQAQAKGASFAGYLRRGGSPFVPEAKRRHLAAARPVARTWEREAMLLADKEGGHDAAF